MRFFLFVNVGADSHLHRSRRGTKQGGQQPQSQAFSQDFSQTSSVGGPASQAMSSYSQLSQDSIEPYSQSDVLLSQDAGDYP